MKYKSFLTYLLALIISSLTFVIADGILLGMSVQCAISLGCDNMQLGFLLIPLGVLIAIFIIGYKVCRVNPVILFLVIFAFPIPVLYAVFYTSSLYNKFSHQQLLDSAKRHTQSIQLKDYVIYPERSNQTIKVNIFIPFTVSVPFNALELEYMFDSVELAKKYPLSLNPLCNKDFYNSISEYSVIAVEGKLFGHFYFLGPPEGTTISDMANFDYNALESYSMLSKNQKQPELIPGRTYYVYEFINVNSRTCSETDFVNQKNISPPIFLKN